MSCTGAGEEMQSLRESYSQRGPATVQQNATVDMTKADRIRRVGVGMKEVEVWRLEVGVEWSGKSSSK